MFAEFMFRMRATDGWCHIIRFFFFTQIGEGNMQVWVFANSWQY